MKPNAIKISTSTLSHLQIRETVLMLACSLIIPFVVHLIPTTGNVPVGAKLLPVFYAPLVASLLFRPHVGYLAASLAPVLNFAVTGKPEWNVVIILTIELLVFVFIMNSLKSVKGIKWVSGPLSYLLAKVCSVSLLLILPMKLIAADPLTFGMHSVFNAIPGLMILLGLTVIILRFWPGKSD